MGLNVSTLARIQSSVQNQVQTSRPYSVHWTENLDLHGWTTNIGVDMVGAWNGFLFATKRLATGAFMQPTDTFIPVDTANFDRIFFRMRYDKHPRNTNPTTFGKVQWTTTAEPLFSSERELTFTVLPDQGFQIYELDMNRSPSWTGLVNNIRFFPCEDGAINDEFFLTFFEIGSLDIDFQMDNPDAGLQGRLVGGEPLTNDLVITRDVNDRLAVNIDGFGFVEVQLLAQTAPPSMVVRDLAVQLSKIAIGGYMRADAFIDPDTRKIVIKSGTRASNSSVSVLWGPQSAAASLGITSADGVFLGETFSGSDPLPSYVPIGDYSPTTFELLNFLDASEDSTAFVLDPNILVLEAGRRDYGEVTKNTRTDVLLEGLESDEFGFQGAKISINGTVGEPGRTFVDLNHPFTDDGLVSSVAFNGIAQEDGSSKWKIFRPQLNGDITLIAEGTIGERTFTDDPTNGLVLTTSPGNYVQDVSGLNVRVRRGDLLGLYNVSLHLGTGRAEKPDALYYDFTGDVQGTVSPSVPSGAGSAGIPVYAVGSARRGRTVIDVDFGRRVSLDSVTINGEVENNDLEYNISTANSSTFSVDAEGTHTICYTVALFVRDCFDRPNTGFNQQALNDTVLFAENGVAAFGDAGPTGLGGASVEGATYFYVNGDGEFLTAFEFDAESQRPALYGFDRDPFGITCFFTSTTPRLDKTISKAVIYFKDPQNMRSWQIEAARGQGTSGGNGSIDGFDLIPQNSIYRVHFDNKSVDRDEFTFTQKDSDTQTLLLRNPVILDVVAADGTVNPQRGVDFVDNARELGGVNFDEQALFLDIQWTRFQWSFDPIRTAAFRWYCPYHFSTKISEFEIYASAPALESFSENIQVLFSADGQTFAVAETLQDGAGSATYGVGNSPRYLRILFRPTNKFFAKNMTFAFENDQLYVGQEGRILGGEPVEDARVGSIGEAKVIPILNNTGRSSDLQVDLPVDVSASQEVLYFGHLNSLDQVHQPEIGGPGLVAFDVDFPLLETENVAQNSTAYGLKGLASVGSLTTFSPELLTNGSFETGDLTGWQLTVSASGTLPYQIPRVFDGATPGSGDFLDTAYQQEGAYMFGYSIDQRVPEQQGQFTPVAFVLESEAVDISDYAEAVDFGGAEALVGMLVAFGYSPNVGAPFYVLGSPTLAGLELSPGSEVSPEYGSNLLRQLTLGQAPSPSISEDNQVQDIDGLTAALKEGTRFLKLRFESSATGSRTIGGGQPAQKFYLDAISLKLKVRNESLVRWYKSWRAGIGDFTDAHFEPITSFTQTAGSHHWYQPFKVTAVNAVPIVGQTQGFSNAFLGDRNLGIQSFARMTQVDPGILASKWLGEKTLAGFRACLSYSQQGGSSSLAWPRHWHVQVLKTAAELGTDPDINNDSHYRTVEVYTASGPWGGSSNEVSNQNDPSQGPGPGGIITTWLFSNPVETEGIRLVFRLNCDQFEKMAFGFSATAQIPAGPAMTAFTAATTCPPTIIGNFFSPVGLSVSYFQPLEKAGQFSLPVDNTKETLYAGSNVFTAVDLRRIYAIETNSHLFELIVDSFNNTDWLTTNFSLSNTNTDDPNAVVWGNTNSQSVRWIRFSTLATEKHEDPAALVTNQDVSSRAGVHVVVVPQSIIRAARIYPDIRFSNIHAVGRNTSWDNLGAVLTDSNSATFVNYSDYPVVVLDLGAPFLLSAGAGQFRPIHPLTFSRAVSTPDPGMWSNDNIHFTYANASYRGVSDPGQVNFLAYGSTAPTYATRWVAFKGAHTLRPNSNLPRTYSFAALGGRVYQSSWYPLTPTEPIASHPTWFRTTKAGLADLSSFDTTLGNTFTAIEGVDFGANKTTTGSAYFPFDARFSFLNNDYWGVLTRSSQTGREDPDFAFPHALHRVFRDPSTFVAQAVRVDAFSVKGYSAKFYPTTFRLQRLHPDLEDQIPVTADPEENAAFAATLRLESSWVDITGASYTDVDTYQDDAGFTDFLGTPVTSKGFRLLVEESFYEDDTLLTDTDDIGGFVTDPNIVSPQTRVVEFVLLEDRQIQQVIEGTVDVNHCLGADVSATSELPSRPASLLRDGDISTTWQSINLSETVSIALPGNRPIHRLEWERDPALGRASGRNSINAPGDFVLRAKQAGQFVEVLSQSGYIGDSFAATISGGPITSAEFQLEITAPQGLQEGANSVQISELRLVEEQVLTTPLVVVESFTGGPNDSSLSTQFRYAANTEAVAVVTADGMDAGSDPLFSERDFFTFDLFIEDISLLNTDFGYVKLGNSSEKSYRWDISDISGLVSGWNEVRLQFKEAADRATPPQETGPNFRTDTDRSQVDFTTEDVEFTSSVDGIVSNRVIQGPGIRFFELQFRGTNAVPDRELVLRLNGFRFERNTFEDTCKFNGSLYLNNSESLQLSVENLDISSGAVKFWLQPDWDSAAILPSRGRVIPSLFTITQPDGKFLNFFYRAGTGFVLVINDNTRVINYETVVSKHPFNRYDNLHIGVVWDSRSGIAPDRTSVQIYVNGRIVFGSNVEWEADRTGRGAFRIGGEVSQVLSANPFNSTIRAFTPIPTLPARHTATVWGLIENLEVYNYPNTDFSHIHDFDAVQSRLLTPNEMLEVSVDGVNFERSGSLNLPLIVDNVPPGTYVPVYVRTNIPKGLSGAERRDATVLLTWRTPRTLDCS